MGQIFHSKLTNNYQDQLSSSQKDDWGHGESQNEWRSSTSNITNNKILMNAIHEWPL